MEPNDRNNEQGKKHCDFIHLNTPNGRRVPRKHSLEHARLQARKLGKIPIGTGLPITQVGSEAIAGFKTLSFGPAVHDEFSLEDVVEIAALSVCYGQVFTRVNPFEGIILMHV